MSLSSLIKTTRTDLYELSDNDLKKLHTLYTEILDDLSRVCNKYSVNWTLSGGSILGAVRHGGFIPWDDDIDIFMTRANFEKFRKIFRKELSDKYNLLLPGENGNLMVFPRIEKKETVVKSIQSVDNDEHGLLLDIFILENTYDNKILRYIHGIECTVLLFIDSVCRTNACKSNLLKYGSNNTELKKAVKKRAALGKLFSFVKLEKWLKITDKVFSKVKSDKTSFVVAPGGAKHFFGEIYKRDKMEKSVRVKFENTKANIPANYDYYLKIRYGSDYMTPPSAKAQEKHVFIKFDIDKK
ncbi:MAG: LicD family protein [Ruminococcus sp.]|nr:LicD family protein [Ruminococcus sp.]MDE6848093.1 LicD family protein [Ruminococcus sp.]MDE7137549.1 LicD family protein [Ruminococcus sp.]